MVAATIAVVSTWMPYAGAAVARSALSVARSNAATPVPMARPGFSDPDVYMAGADAVAVADFTGDGRADVAVANPVQPGFTSAETVALFVQTPTGALSPYQYLPAHTGDLAFVSAVAADVTGDGRTDLLVGSNNGVDLFVQQGGGLLPGQLITTVGVREIKVADINGDGRPDLVADTYNSGLVTMLNLGGGQFAAPVTVATDATYEDFAVGDVTGDGIADIVGWPGNQVEVRAGRGDGTFAPPVEYPVPGYDEGRGVAIGDFNGDGRNDVAVTNSRNNPGSAVDVYYQTSAGTLGPAVMLPSYDVADMIEAVDVNGDGRTDLVVAHGGWYNVGVYLQQPDGSFSPEQLYYIGAWDDFTFSSGLAVADVNGDGLPDILTGDDGDLVVLRQLPGGAPAATSISPQGSEATTAGTPITGTAILSGGFYPTGTMRFALHGPNDPNCTATPVFTTSDPVDGNATYVSAPFVPSAAGTYHFQAFYSGDANNAPATPGDCATGIVQTVTVADHAIFTSPWDGQPNVDTTKPLTWKTLPAAQAYYLVVGSAPYGKNLVNSGVLPASASSFPMPDLPAGTELYATLLTEVHGAWTGYQASVFTAAVGHATFTNPVAGQVDVDTTKPFTWTALPAAQAYILVAGTTVYGTDLLISGILPASQSSYPMPALPAGRPIYATLLTEVNGAWTRFQAVTFTAGPRN